MNADKFAGHLPGTPDQVRNVRSVIAETLGPDHPCLGDAVLLASETATNAVRHSDSGLPGGRFALGIEHTDAWARVAVRDDGSPTMPCLCRAQLMTEHGRGVRLLDVLACRWGLVRQNRRTEVWFEVGQ